jgi:hypothetical protein
VAVKTATSWTADRCPRAEARVSRDLSLITAETVTALGSDLEALVLVGSYARGEGGVSETTEGVRAFNDYDLLCVVPAGAMRRARAALPAVAARCEALVGVSVDLWPITAEAIAHAPRTLFWLDAALGGARVLAGTDDVLAPLSGRSVRELPMDEAGRLLANRAAGLALSRLGGRWASPALWVRHAHKAVLACGDALLLGARVYVPGLSARRDALAAICANDGPHADLPMRYADALAFRRDAGRWSPPHQESLSSWCSSVVTRVSEWHLTFERWRLGTPLDPVGYARWTGAVYPESEELRSLRGRAAALQSALRGVVRGRIEHPRARLARAAVGLAYADDHDLPRLCETLLPGGATNDGARTALERLVHAGG